MLSPKSRWANLPIRVKCTAAVFLPISALIVAGGLAYRLKLTSQTGILAPLVLGLVTATAAAKLLSRSITRRVSELVEAVGVVGHGMTVSPTDKSHDELGKLSVGLAHTSRLLSERQAEINEMSSWLQSVLRAATETSIVAEDSNGRITVFNAGAEKLLGYKSPDVMGRNLAVLFHSGSLIGGSRTIPDSVQSAREVALRNCPCERESFYIRKDGSSVDVQLSVTPLKNATGRIVGLLHIAQDLSPRRALERELTAKNEELRALAQRLAESNAAKDVLLDRLDTDASYLRPSLITVA